MEKTIEQQVAETNKNVNLILILLQGHEMDKTDKGMIGKVHDQEVRIEKFEKKIERITWTMAGMCVTAGAGIFAVLRKFITTINSIIL